MRFQVTEASAAAPDTLWQALSDLESWPRWCPTATAVQPDGPFETGTAVRVVQPGLRPAVWTIEEIVPGRSFRWRTRGPGFAMVADHLLEPTRPGTTIRFSQAVTGIMAWAVWLIAGRATRDHLREQARALAGRPNPAA